MSTIDTARDEFYAARKAAREARRAFAHSTDSTFVRTMHGAMAQYLTMRAEGVSREDAVRGLEAELRDAWPKSVSKFRPACDGCDDTGFREMVCWDQQRCGREVCAKNPERFHHYVVPCECGAGNKKRDRQRTPEDALTTIGRTHKRKPGGWRQVGQ